jgi:hypothetical protein
MDFDMKKLVSVKNRSAGRVVYRIPEHGIRREFNSNEIKQIPYEELVWLSYRPGGRNLMTNMLQIQEIKATENLNIHTEPEYFMSEDDVVKLLQEGSLDALKDALDFAPKGVIQIIKDKAVELPVHDMRKRQAILEMTGYDVTAAIENNTPDEDEVVADTSTPTRRVQKDAETPAIPTRRTESKYKIIE